MSLLVLIMGAFCILMAVLIGYATWIDREWYRSKGKTFVGYYFETLGGLLNILFCLAVVCAISALIIGAPLALLGSLVTSVYK